jgi:hypothetical protein
LNYVAVGFTFSCYCALVCDAVKILVSFVCVGVTDVIHIFVSNSFASDLRHWRGEWESGAATATRRILATAA